MIIAVGSTNPVKIEATKETLEKILFPPIEVRSVDVSSGVPPQPLSMEEAMQGAKNRAKAALEKIDNAVIGVGIEGGVDIISGILYSFGAICLRTIDGVEGSAYTPFFELPMKIKPRLFAGEELGKIMEELTGIKEIKKKEGAVGWYTRGFMTRKELYSCGMRVAIINLLHSNSRITKYIKI